MIFHTTHKFTSSLSQDEIKKRLVGKHVKIHTIDFEVYEKNGLVKIIPHAEQIDAIKSLPISHVHLKEKGNKTGVRLTSHMRRIDAGGPSIVVVFGFFMILAGVLFLLIGKEAFVGFAAPLIIFGLILMIILMIRLQRGYYDYCRKVKQYVRSLTAPV